MKNQWRVILGLVLVLIVVIFAEPKIIKINGPLILVKPKFTGTA